MTILKLQQPALLLGAAALILDRVHAHGYCSRPAVTFPNGGDSTQFVATIESSASGLPGSFTGSPADNAAAFWTAFGSSKYTSIKDLATSLGQIVAKGATLECGLTDPNETPQPLPDQIEWSHSSTEGFTPSHEGPCEAWCDGTQVFQDKNCAAHFTGIPAKMPYDKAKCSGASRFTFYWLALHSSTWQVYVNCAALEGGSGMYSPSQTDANASESTEQSTTPTASTTDTASTTSTTPVPTMTTNSTTPSDQSYSFTAPSTNSTTVPVNTSETPGQSTAPTTLTAAPSTSTAPTAPSDQSYNFSGTTAAPSTTSTTIPVNTSETSGQSTAPTAPSDQSYNFSGTTATPNTTEADPTKTSTTTSDPMYTTTATVVTPTTEGNSSPTVNGASALNGEVVQDDNLAGAVGSDEDCGSLDLAGSGNDNDIVANTAAGNEEDCGSLDLAGSGDMEDCGSLDLAGGSVDGVGRFADNNSITFDSARGGLTGENSTAFSESSLNFDDVDRSYIGGKVQAPIQN